MLLRMKSAGVAFACSLLVSACGTDRGQQAPTNEWSRGDDLEQLRRVPIPELFRHGSWVSGSPPQSIALGPRDTRLFLWLPVADPAAGGKQLPSWGDIATVVGTPGGTQSRTIPRAAAEALLPPNVLPGLSGDDQSIHVSGPGYAAAAFESTFWKHGWVIALEDGLVVGLTSG